MYLAENYQQGMNSAENSCRSTMLFTDATFVELNIAEITENGKKKITYIGWYYLRK